MTQLDPVVAAELAVLPSGLDTLILGSRFMKVDFESPDYDALHSEQRDLGKANVTASQSKTTDALGSSLHAVMLDIDVPAFLLPSSTPGHSHLYVDLLCSWPDYLNFLIAAKRIGLIEEGYVKASKKRGFSTLRLPWIKKATRSTANQGGPF